MSCMSLECLASHASMKKIPCHGCSCGGPLLLYLYRFVEVVLFCLKYAAVQTIGIKEAMLQQKLVKAYAYKCIFTLIYIPEDI